MSWVVDWEYDAGLGRRRAAPTNRAGAYSAAELVGMQAFVSVADHDGRIVADDDQKGMSSSLDSKTRAASTAQR